MTTTEEIERLRAELAEAKALAADATEYRVRLPHGGGTILRVRRQSWATGDGWAVSTEARGGGRAWTEEGWQEVISALSVDRLFCWPDATTAIREGREALEAEVRCGECGGQYKPEPRNTTGFCCWDCFDAEERPGAPEAFHAFLGYDVTMTRVDDPEDS